MTFRSNDPLDDFARHDREEADEDPPDGAFRESRKGLARAAGGGPLHGQEPGGDRSPGKVGAAREDRDGRHGASARAGDRFLLGAPGGGVFRRRRVCPGASWQRKVLPA